MDTGVATWRSFANNPVTRCSTTRLLLADLAPWASQSQRFIMIRIQPTPLCIHLLLFLFCCQPIVAQTKSRSPSLVGQTVMPKQSIKFRMGARELDQPLPLPLDVYAEDGEWLFVSGGKVRKSDVVKTKDAPAYYQSLLDANPRNAWALCQKGLLLGSEGELEQALKDFNQAIAIDPGYAEAFVMRGSLHATNEDFDQAIEDYTKAIQLRPDYADAYHQRGFCYFENLDDNDLALADFDKAIQVCPEYSEAYAGRGLIYQYIGRIKDALADYDRAIELDPYAVDSLSNRALIRSAGPDEALRDGKLAVADAEKACKITKFEDTDALVVLAAAYAEDGRFDQAIETQMKAVLKSDGKDRIDMLKKLGLYRSKQPYRYEQP